jgi:hypothetical protein
LGLGIWGLSFGVKGLEVGFRVLGWSIGFRVQGSGFRV